jgi:hypothetical protein
MSAAPHDARATLGTTIIYLGQGSTKRQPAQQIAKTILLKHLSLGKIHGLLVFL